MQTIDEATTATTATAVPNGTPESTNAELLVALRRWVERAQSGDAADTAATPKPLGGSALAGMTHVFGSRYFLAISVVSVLASLLGTALYMFMNALVGETIAGADARTKLFAYLDLGTGMLTVVFQLLVVRHAVHKLGLGMTFALMPLLSDRSGRSRVSRCQECAA